MGRRDFNRPLPLEDLYRAFADQDVEPTAEGRQQFHEEDTHGRQPASPDPFYLALRTGKKWFSVQQADIRSKWGSGEWVGWYQHWKDFKGERWILGHLMSWYPDLPSWLTKEDDELTVLELAYLFDEAVMEKVISIKGWDIDKIRSLVQTIVGRVNDAPWEGRDAGQWLGVDVWKWSRDTLVVRFIDIRQVPVQVQGCYGQFSVDVLKGE